MLLDPDKKSYLAYITAGFPDVAYTVDAALSLFNNGVDLLELGLPFTDPVADGPVIQQAHSHALDKKFKPQDYLNILKKIRKQSKKPIILMGYLNPILTLIKNGMLAKFAKAGLNGILTVDLPVDENLPNIDYAKYCEEINIAPIYIITPNTPLDRVKFILQKANSHKNKGFIYYAIRSGVTGINKSNSKNFTLPKNIIKHIEFIKSKTNLPVVTGFGISNKKMAKNNLKVADGFVAGSYFVKAIGDGSSAKKIGNIARELDPRESINK
jgi:tryptophan synthase alpha chain